MVGCRGSSRSRAVEERFWLGVDGFVGLNSLPRDLVLLVTEIDASFLRSGPDVAVGVAVVGGGAFLLDGVRKKAATWGLLLFGDDPST